MLGHPLNRRSFLTALGAASLTPLTAQGSLQRLSRPIPKSGERVPIIGMGSWITMNVGKDPALRAARTKVIQTFFAEGGGMIDSSPMYGSAEAVIGHALARLPGPRNLFSATKVWTATGWMGRRQMENSFELWDLERFDLLQIHNLLDWETHLETLLTWKAEGRVRYIGVTTSHGRRHQDLAAIMRRQPIDFVQFTYNIVDREAESMLLPLAAERGLAVIVNRPFQRGALFDRFAKHPLPAWAGEFDCSNWAQFFLKFAVSHPAVTCAIPATSRVDHMLENMGAGVGLLPDRNTRTRMVRAIETL